MPVPLVRVVVLNYQGGDHVLRCLDSLRSGGWPEERLQVVVVDNASSDGSDVEIERRHPWVELRRSPTNRGFPANNDALVDLHGVDFVALLNNDATVTPGWLGPLVTALQDDPGLGAACPKILFAPRFVDVPVRSTTRRPGGADPRELGVMVSGVRVGGVDVWGDAQLVDGFHGLEVGPVGPFHWSGAEGVVRLPVPPEGPVRAALRLSADGPRTVHVGADGPPIVVGTSPTWVEAEVDGARYDVINNVGSMVLPDGSGADRGFLERDDGQHDVPSEVFAWCGAAVLLRPSYLRAVGLFEPRFFMYYEDTDLSWRGQAQGWRYRYVPDSVVRHVHAATSVEGSALFHHYVERNRLLMLTRNAPAGLAVRASSAHLRSTLGYVKRDVIAPVLRRRRPAPTLVRRRIRSWLSWARLLPWAIVSRRRLRAAQVVTDRELLARVEPR